jgi:hypothetical protein
MPVVSLSKRPANAKDSVYGAQLQLHHESRLN